MIQFDEHMFQRGWFNHQLGPLEKIFVVWFVSAFSKELLDVYRRWPQVVLDKGITYNPYK